jgi:hypothetical protein
VSEEGHRNQCLRDHGAQHAVSGPEMCTNQRSRKKLWGNFLAMHLFLAQSPQQSSCFPYFSQPIVQHLFEAGDLAAVRN